LCDESQTGSGDASVVTHAYVGGDDASMTGLVPVSTAASSPLASSVMMLTPPPSTVASSPAAGVAPESSELLFKPVPLLLLPELPELPELPLDTLASGALPLLPLLVGLPSPGSVAVESPVAHAEATRAMPTMRDPRWLWMGAMPDTTELFIAGHSSVTWRVLPLKICSMRRVDSQAMTHGDQRDGLEKTSLRVAAFPLLLS
jgi:hypothetical protein